MSVVSIIEAATTTPRTTGGGWCPRCRVAVLAEILTIKEGMFATMLPHFNNDILSVTVGDDLGQPHAKFNISLRYRTVPETDYTWADLIPLYSVVIIEMQRDPEAVLSLDDDPIVMIGLVKQAVVQESYAGSKVQRTISISGGSLGAILADAKIYHNPYVEFKPGDPGINGTIDAAMALFGKLAWNPKLVMANTAPQLTLSSILQHFIFNSPTGVINVKLPPPLMLETLLSYGGLPMPLHWTPASIGLLPAGDASPMSGGPLPVWSYLERFIDAAFNEFFTRVECGKVVIHFRGRPFTPLPWNPATMIAPVTNMVPSSSVRTHFLHADDILTQTRVYSDEVFNLFYVRPVSSQYFMNNTAFRTQVAPVVCGDFTSPSYVGKWGLRVMEVTSQYLPIGGGPLAESTIKVQTKILCEMLKAWYEKNPIYHSANITVPGRGSYKKGHRLVVSQGGSVEGMDREYYIEGVNHSYDMNTNSFTTTLRLTRGWDIAREHVPLLWSMPPVNPMLFIVGPPDPVVLGLLEAQSAFALKDLL